MNIILAAMLLAAEPVAEEKMASVVEIQAETEKKVQTSRATIEQIRQDYIQGKYKESLKELDSAYSKANQNDGLSSLAEMRVGPVEGYQNFESLMLKTLKERNEKIKQAVQGKNEEITSIAASATTSTSLETEQALSRLNQLHLLAPGKGGNPDENRIIDIDFEYEYKAMHLDMPILTGEKIENIQGKQIALQMEKLDRMLEASRNFKDQDLKASIETIHSQFDSLLIQSQDQRKINALSRNAQTDLEKKIGDIVSEYGKKLSDQSKEFLENQRAENNE